MAKSTYSRDGLITYNEDDLCASGECPNDEAFHTVAMGCGQIMFVCDEHKMLDSDPEYQQWLWAMERRNETQGDDDGKGT